MGYGRCGLVAIQLALGESAAVNEHRCTSAKRSGIARLAPLHVGKASNKCYEKQVRRYVLGPGRLRVNGDKENGEQGQGANPGNHYVLPNREFGRLFPAHIAGQGQVRHHI